MLQNEEVRPGSLALRTPTIAAFLLLFALVLLTRGASAQIVSATVTPNNLPATGGSVTLQAVMAAAFIPGSVSAIQNGIGIGPLTFISANGDGTRNYARVIAIPANNTQMPRVYSYMVTATDSANHTTTATAGNVDVAAPAPIVINTATLSTNTLTAAGGNVTVTANVSIAAPNAVSAIRAYRNGVNLGALTLLSNNGDGTQTYTGAFNFAANVTNAPKPYLITVYAADAIGNVTAKLAGNVTQGSVTPISIVSASVSTNTLPASGGNVTVTATINAPAPNAVNAIRAYRNGVNLGSLTLLSTNADGSRTYSGAFNFAINASIESPINYLITAYASDSAGNVTAKTIGVVTQAGVTPISIVSASVSTNTLPAAASPITVTATVNAPAPNGVNNLIVYRNSVNIGALTLSATNADGSLTYTGTFTIAANVTTSPNAYLLSVRAADTAGNVVYRSLGTLTQAASTPISIVSVSLSTNALPAAGGSVTVTTTVNAPAPNDVTSVIVLRNGGNIGTLTLQSTNANGSKTYSGAVTLPATGATATKYFLTVRANDNLSALAYRTAGVVTVGTGVVGAPIHIVSSSFTPATLPADGGRLIVNATVSATTQSNAITIYANGGSIGSLTYQTTNANGTFNYSGSFAIAANNRDIPTPYELEIIAQDQSGNQDTASLGTLTVSPVTPISIVSVTQSATAFPAAGGYQVFMATVKANSPSIVSSIFVYTYSGSSITVSSLTYLYMNPDGSLVYLGATPIGSNIQDIPRPESYSLVASDNTGNTAVAPIGAATVGVVTPISVVSATLSSTFFSAAGGNVEVLATVKAPDSTNTLSVYVNGTVAGNLTLLSQNPDGSATYFASIVVNNNISDSARTDLYTLSAADNADNRVFTALGSVIVAPVTPISIVNAGISVTSLGNTGGDILVTATVTAPDPNSVSAVSVASNGINLGALTYQNTNADSSRNYSGSFSIAANATSNPQAYLFTITATDNADNIATAALGSVTTDAFPGTVAGKITLEGLVSTAPAQTITFEFRPDDNSGVFTRTASVGPDGNFNLMLIPRKNYDLRIKGPKNLAKVTQVNTLNSDAHSVTAFLPGGDADNSNFVDIADFGIVVGAFGAVNYDVNTGYDARADFNGDGNTDVADFSILVNNFGNPGDP